MSILNWFKSKAVAVEGKGSAFARVALHEAEVIETKGKIIALDLANKAAHSTLAVLEGEAVRVHVAQDAIDVRRAKLAALL